MSEPYFEMSPEEIEQAHFAAWEEEYQLWSKMVGSLYLFEDDRENYHHLASAEAKTGKPTWWVREVSDFGLIIDYFEDDICVGTVVSDYDLATVDATDLTGVTRTGLPLAKAVELITLEN